MSRSIVITAGLFLLILTVFRSYSAAQTCNFDISGDWDLLQNNRILVKISLSQKGDKVTGQASYEGVKQGHKHTETGDVTGTFSQMGTPLQYRLRIKIRWDYGETGIYTGTVMKRYSQTTGRSDGKWWMYGDAYIQEDPENNARKTGWHFARTLPCH